jgi:hypothetical protein
MPAGSTKAPAGRTPTPPSGDVPSGCGPLGVAHLLRLGGRRACVAPKQRVRPTTGYPGAIAIVAALTAASGLWVLVDTPTTHRSDREAPVAHDQRRRRAPVET